MNLVGILALLLLLVYSGTVLPVSDLSHTFAAYVPRYIRPGVHYSVDVELYQYPKPVNINGKLFSSDFSSSVTAQLSLEGSVTANLAFDMLPFGYDGSTHFEVSVTGTDSVTGEEIFSDSTNDIRYQKKFVSIFIQTDKAIYQPRHMIKFRAIVTTPDLLPYGDTVSYRLEDPNGNVILKESNAQLTHGVVGNEFKLGRYSTLGDWRIIYKVHGFEESISVLVAEYKLPKFSVEIKTDQSFLHPGSQRLTGEVTATYTFGQPVRGSAVVEMYINNWWGFPPQKLVLQYPEFDGRESIYVERFVRVLSWYPEIWSQPLIIKVNVTDKNTGEEIVETKNVDMHRIKIKVKTVAKPTHIKPGLPYVAYLQISQRDGSPLDASDLEDLQMEMQVSYRYVSYWYWRPPKNLEYRVPLAVGHDGIIIFNITANAEDFISVDFNVKIPSYPGRYSPWVRWSVERFESPSNTFLQVSTDDTTLSVGDTASLVILTTAKSQSYRISLIARGKVVMSTLYQPPAYDDHNSYSAFTYTFTVELEHSPSLHAVVSYVRASDGEFIADALKINVQAALDNEVTITALPNKTDAGMPVSIRVQAEAGSFIGLRAIDQSVVLLKSGNDITREKIFQDLGRYGPGASRGGRVYPPWGGWWWPWSVGGADVGEVFQNSGFIVLSDAKIYRPEPGWPQYDYDWPDLVAEENGGGFERPMPDTADSDEECVESDTSLSSSQQDIQARVYFPESWIWTDSTTGDNGSVTFNYNVPDTITTWELSSFAVSDTKGLGVTKDHSKITVFRNFFISLDLPPSIIKGEIFNMKVTIFNYFDQEVTATVTLIENDWYSITERERDGMTPPGVLTQTIPSKDSMVVVFPIEFTKAGSARVQIRAISALAADQVERTLRVKPEGIPKVVSQSSIIDRRDENEAETVVTFDVDIPPDAVEGSVYIKFAVSGKILGNALSNIGNLLKMPGGCGEQTMLSLAPDVYIVSYLRNVDELTGEIKRKSEHHIREGYQNELRYQREDGSFSAFGKSDRTGSTWLTAFVAKVFSAANEFNPDLIQETKIEQALRFILKQQNRRGTFNEPGRVIHKDMQGGVHSNVTTAAYMLISMAEGETFKRNENVQAAIAKTQRYLERRVDRLRDIYTLSIVGYALSLVESSKAGNVLNVIDSMSTTEANVRYWKKEESGAAKCTVRQNYCPFHSNKPSSSAVEITAYVLLTYVKQGRINEVMPVVRWLVQQRGAFGGYHSTQDTVMAIQALSTVAGIFSQRLLAINVAHDGQPEYSASFELSDENSLVLQMADLPGISGNVVVTGAGQGFADVQVTVGYNLPVGPKTDEPFVLDIEVRKIVEQVMVEVCSKINEDRQEVVYGTGMYVVTFELPSGYTIDDKKATEQNPQAKLIEVVVEDVTGYFDELPRGESICMSLELIKYAEIEEVKSKLVTAYDYYKPEKSAMRMLSLPPDKECPCCESNYSVPCCECLKPATMNETYCGTVAYPCPVFVDGLFYDSSSQIALLTATHPEGNSCRAPEGAGDSRMYTGLPASELNGVDQYIECSGTPHFEAMLRSLKGFTFSIAVYPTELDEPKYYTILSISSASDKRPYVLLAKRPRSTQYWLKILLNGQRLVVQAFHDTDIPINRWSLITGLLDGDEARVFVNGEKVGRYARRKQKTGDVEGAVTLKVGRSHVGGRLSRGHFNGLVASLDTWLRPLTDEEVLAHYNYWESSITDANPTLDVAKVHHIIPRSIRKCFSKSYTAMELKSLAGRLQSDCDESNVTPPTITEEI